jgi:hypothetical protein
MAGAFAIYGKQPSRHMSRIRNPIVVAERHIVVSIRKNPSVFPVLSVIAFVGPDKPLD